MSLKINLYAEFLLNIRQVTIFATLQNDRTEESIAYVTSDKKSLTVVHDTESATITFPSGISGKATVNFPVARSKTVSLRLEIIEDDKPAHDLGVGIDNDSPWPASSLGQETDIACRSCEEIIVAARSRVWKDLPREDWAEMMDLWHCHKPTTKDPPSQEQSTKGYAATNKLRARPGVGFVDTCHVVVTKEECTSIKVNSLSESLHTLVVSLARVTRRGAVATLGGRDLSPIQIPKSNKATALNALLHHYPPHAID